MMLFFITSCDEPCVFSETNCKSGGEVSGGTTDGTSRLSLSTIELSAVPLDCTNPDPSRVYIKAVLSSSNFPQRYVLADIVNPESFCLGFPNTADDRDVGFIDNDGQLYSPSSGDIYRFVPDSLMFDSESGLIVYPENPEANDLIDRTAPEGCAYLSLLKFNPEDNSSYFYNCNFDNRIHSESEDSYFFDAENDTDLLATFPDNSVLINPRLDSLSVVRPDRTIIDISLPAIADGSRVRRYEGTRHFGSGDTAGVWITAIYLDESTNIETAGRWAININTLVITDEGLFSAPLAEGSKFGSGVLDGDGNLYEIATDSATNIGEVRKRYLESLAVPSEVVFSNPTDTDDGDWREGATPFIRTSDGNLVTGP